MGEGWLRHFGIKLKVEVPNAGIDKPGVVEIPFGYRRRRIWGWGLVGLGNSAHALLEQLLENGPLSSWASKKIPHRDYIVRPVSLSLQKLRINS